MSGIRHKAVNAVIWSGAEKLSYLFIRQIIQILLARILMPEEYGLVAMLGLFTGVASVFVNCGFGEGLIQKQNVTHKDECSVFYLNIAFGGLSAIGLTLAAPWIADFYHKPVLVLLTRLMALDVFINSFGVVQTILLTKEIDFKTQLKASVVSTLIGGGVAWVMAKHGFGVWSIAAQILVGDTAKIILLWAWHKWRPTLTFSRQSLRELMPFGSRIFASALLYCIFNEIYTLVIGKRYSAAELGYYNRAKSTPQMPVETLYSIVGRVSFPVFAAVQHDKPALKRGIRKAVTGLAMINFPMMVGLAVVARPLVLVLLTEKWAHCIPYVQIMCIGGLAFPIGPVHLHALAAQGRSDLFLRLEIIKRIFVVAAVALTFHFGVKALIVGEVSVTCLAWPLFGYYSVKLVGYTWKEQIGDLLPFLGAALLMGVGVYAAGFLPFIEGNAGKLAVQLAVGAVLYPLICQTFRVPAFLEARAMVLRRVPRWKAA